MDLYPWTGWDLRGDGRREPPLAQRRVPTEPGTTLATLLTKHDVSRIDYTMIKKNLPGTPPTGTRSLGVDADERRAVREGIHEHHRRVVPAVKVLGVKLRVWVVLAALLPRLGL